MKTDIFYFSPTGTTRRIAMAIASGIDCEYDCFDLTLPGARTGKPVSEGDAVVIVLPVYGERLPKLVVRYLECLSGRGRPLIGVSVYGNVGFGISLEQYASFAEMNDFMFIAAGAFIAQHTYARKSVPVGFGRPNKQDLSEAKAFGARVREKIDASKRSPILLPKSNLPKFLANTPDGTVRVVIRTPKVDRTLCNSCGACVKRCPLGAIDPGSLDIDERKCLRCLACVQACTEKARAGEFRFRFFQRAFKKLGSKQIPNRLFL